MQLFQVACRSTTSKLIPYLSNDLRAFVIGTEITAGQTYTIPTDGYYVLVAYNNSTNPLRGAAIQLNGTDILANGSNVHQQVLLPLKKDTVITTRANVDLNDDFKYVLKSSFVQ